MPTSELNDDNYQVRPLIETPKQKAEREQREKRRKSFIAQLKELARPVK